MSRLQEVLGPGNKACYIWQTLMEFKHPKYYKEMRKLARAQALKQAIQETVPQCDIEEANKSTSSQASGRKPSSPEPRGQASNPRNSVPRSGNQGTSESAQASLNRKQG